MLLGWVKRRFLQDLGFGIVPLYVGEQVEGSGSLDPTSAKGTIDGNDAVQMMTSEGLLEGPAYTSIWKMGSPSSWWRFGLELRAMNAAAPVDVVCSRCAWGRDRRHGRLCCGHSAAIKPCAFGAPLRGCGA